MKHLPKLIVLLAVMCLGLSASAQSADSSGGGSVTPDWVSTNHATGSYSYCFIQLTVSAGTTISFDWKVSSAENSGTLSIEIMNTVSQDSESLIESTSGEQSGHVSYTIETAGDYIFDAIYWKQRSDTGGDDAATISNFQMSGADEIYTTSLANLSTALTNNKGKISSYWYSKASAVLDDATQNSYTGMEYVKMARKLQKMVTCTSEYTIINMGDDAAGTLSDLVSAKTDDVTTITNLLITGKMNSEDMAYLSNLTNLVNLDLSGVTGVTETPSGWLKDFSSLYSVLLPDGIKAIGDKSFANNVIMAVVESPNTVTEIGDEAFNECMYLESINLPEGLTSIGDNAFNTCMALHTNGIPSTVRHIGDYAFYMNYMLEEVVIPEGVTEVGECAFSTCMGLKSVTLPSTLATLDYTFSWSFSLNTVKDYSLIPQNIKGDPFLYMSVENLYVPSMALESYKAADRFKNFTNYYALDENPSIISIGKDITYTLPSDWPADYKPNFAIIPSTLNGEDVYGALTLVDADEANPATLATDAFEMTANPYKTSVEGGSTAYYNSLVNNANMTAESVTVHTIIANGQWNYLCFPFDVKVSEITDMYYGQAKAIRRYSGASRATGDMQNSWVKVADDEVIKAGEGFVINAAQRSDENGDGCTYSGFDFTTKDDTKDFFTAGNVTVGLTAYGDENTYDKNRSWNFLGNPYPAYFNIASMDYQSPIVVWDFNNSTYSTYVPSDGDEYVLRPFEAFFCQKPDDMETILFSMAGRQTTPVISSTSSAKARAPQTSDRTIINLTLTDGTSTDRTRVVINEDAKSGYDLGHDASKFMSTNNNVPQLYTVAGGEQYSINERPLADGTVILGAKFGSTGAYTISLGRHDDAAVVLTDRVTGKSVNLSEGDYTFDASKGQTSARFVLTVGRDDSATAIASLMQQAKGQTEAVYTIDGRKVSGMDVPGTYIIRSAGNVEKVIVK